MKIPSFITQSLDYSLFIFNKSQEHFSKLLFKSSAPSVSSDIDFDLLPLPLDDSNEEVLFVEETTKTFEVSKKRFCQESVKPKEDSTKETHGIVNSRFFCYLISTYQLFSNIPTLKAHVIDKLPDSLALLKDYSCCTSGDQLLSAINKTKTEKFSPDQGEDASEVYTHLLSLISLTSPIFETLIEEELLVFDTEQPALSHLASIIEKKEFLRETLGLSEDLKRISSSKGCLLNCNIKFQEGESLDFYKAFQDGRVELSNHHVINELGVAYEISKRETFFEKQPNHLFLKVPRFSSEKKDDRPFDFIPECFDLCEHFALKNDEGAKKLNLKGFILHIGSGVGQVGGHYVTCFLKEGPSGDLLWHLANDEEISLLSKDEAFALAKSASDFYYE